MSEQNDCTGAMMETNSVRMVFDGDNVVEEKEGEARILASADVGTFSIRDLETSVMVTVALQDAAEVMKCAVQKQIQRDKELREENE